ncbi:DUF6318 family protein [Actinomyces bouchesdurhonensis]|uniref:DUF6318 family protein n=1 Tax=Actinomyces bouchesdurhonensis TaxID=1852361 RepID=UPI0028EE43D5|nr:DUF6318 family protein [Actinomyces bouchesdurhonensis]
MMVPPLSERPVTDEDEEQFRRESAPRKYTLRRRWADYRAEVKARRPKGARARARAWLHVEPFYWGMRVVYVALFAGAVFAVYINGVAEGWWPAWGERPTVAATTTPPAARPVPTASATASGEAAMSGGYQIGPDGVLVRPAEHAASTYTKPELPDEAKENTERGAEAAAEYYLATLIYAFNTGDTQPFADMSSPTSKFASDYINDVNEQYSDGWNYGMESNITYVLRVEPVEANGNDVPQGSILVKFRTETYEGTSCTKTKVETPASKYKSTVTFIMAWQDGKWKEIQGRTVADNED